MDVIPSKSSKRAFVKIDRYAMFDIGRAYRLSSNERQLLLSLTIDADFRSATWRGTFSDIAERTGIDRRAVSHAIKHLAELGLVEIEQPFGGHRQGELLLLCFHWVVVPEVRDAEAHELAKIMNQRIAQICTIAPLESDSIRALIVHYSRSKCTQLHNSRASTSNSAASGGSAAERQGGSGALVPPDGTSAPPDEEEERENNFGLNVEICTICKQPADDTHPFGHDPMTAITEDEGAQIIEFAFGISQ